MEEKIVFYLKTKNNLLRCRKDKLSSNNQLIILKEKGKYEVWENHCVDNEFNKKTATRVSFNTSLRKAIIFVNKYMNENLVEYGYYIDESCLTKQKDESS